MREPGPPHSPTGKDPLMNTCSRRWRMPPAGVVLFGFLVVWFAAGPSSARRRPLRPIAPPSRGDRLVTPRRSPAPRGVASRIDTTILADFTFDVGGSCDAQGWTTWDRTAQPDRFHVDDFAGAGDPTGWLSPLEGARSLWCGAPASPGDPALCAYATLPGYGNDWNQAFCLRTCVGGADAAVRFVARWDLEAGYDGVTVEVDRCDDDWTPLPGTDAQGFHLSGTGEGTVSLAVPPSVTAGSFRVRLHVTSDGAWSDEDGLYDSRGGLVVDSLGVATPGGWLVQPETFEGFAVGDTATTDWVACVPPGYGSFAGLFPGTAVLQEDPCVRNPSCLWGFFAGSTADYACGGHPEQLAVPYGNARGQYLDDAIVSPPIPLAGSGPGVEMAFDVYEHMPLDALVVYTWAVRTISASGCPGPWRENAFYFPPVVNRRWIRRRVDLRNLIDWGSPAPLSIQVALIVVDMCPYWCGVYGSGACHTHAPLFDNVALYRFDDTGPAWLVDEAMLFQDTFPPGGAITGPARADVALDLLASSATPTVRPGDSAVVHVTDPVHGIDVDGVGGGPAVYAWIHSSNPAHRGAVLTDDPVRWPVVDSMVVAGRTWTAVRMDSVRDASGAAISADRFCVDLHDSLFAAGDTVEFVFAARSAGVGVTTYWTRDAGRTWDMAEAFASPMEFTVLPTHTTDILYVDVADGRGYQPVWETALAQLGLVADRYDVRAPFEATQNGLATRVSDVTAQIAGIYHTILWGGGDAPDPVGDGDWTVGRKSDDATLLWRFLDQSTGVRGVVFTGEWLPIEWNGGTGLGGDGPNLHAYIQHALVATDHTSIGLPQSPLTGPAPGGCFAAAGLPDSILLDGGCPDRRRFAVLSPLGQAVAELVPGPPWTQPQALAVSQTTINAAGWPVGVVLTSFDMAVVRTGGAPTGASARAHLLGAMLDCIGQPHAPVTGVGATAARRTMLAPAAPNPFNPTTVLRYTVRERARVRLVVYDVAGRRVRVLVDGERAPGVPHAARWDGRDDRGRPVASGVYFARLVAGRDVVTRKLVLLK